MPEKTKPKPSKKVRQPFTIDPAVLKNAKDKRKRTGISLSWVVEEALRKWIEQK